MIESKNANLTGVPLPGQDFSYDGFPVSNAVAYSISKHSTNLVSPFAEPPTFTPFNTDKLKNAILRIGEAIKKFPNKQVWAAEMRDGNIVLYVGDYGNVNASACLGAIKGSNASKRDPAFVNATMAEYDAEYIRRGESPQFTQAIKQQTKSKSLLSRIKNYLK